MSYKNDSHLVISNKYGDMSGDAKALLFETYDLLRDITVSGSASDGAGLSGSYLQFYHSLQVRNMVEKYHLLSSAGTDFALRRPSLALDAAFPARSLVPDPYARCCSCLRRDAAEYLSGFGIPLGSFLCNSCLPAESRRPCRDHSNLLSAADSAESGQTPCRRGLFRENRDRPPLLGFSEARGKSERRR